MEIGKPQRIDEIPEPSHQPLRFIPEPERERREEVVPSKETEKEREKVLVPVK